MFKTVFAADIGSKCIKCVARGQVAAEETAIALEAGAKLTVAAAGNAALLHRSGVIRPVRDGAAANTRMLALLLGRLACEKTGKRTTASIELHAAIPHMLPTVKQNALKQAARLAGFRALQVHDPLLMGAIGADADLFSDRAHMIVNIGAETMTCAAFANGGMLWQGFSGSNRKKYKNDKICRYSRHSQYSGHFGSGPVPCKDLILFIKIIFYRIIRIYNRDIYII